jgi:hypothetical protein
VRRHAILAIILAGGGVLGLIFTVVNHRGVREDVARDYRKVGTRPPPGGEGSGKPTLVYASAGSVSKTAAQIVGKHKPADRRTTESGAFLRYRDDVISVVPPPKGQRGSRILVDDEEGGYHRNYGYVGGFWGTYSGPAGSFRGGGPGSGK